MKCFLTLLAIGTALALSAQEKGIDPGKEKKMVAYWNFDEGQGELCRDVSGNGNDLKIDHNMRGVKWTDGRKGKALHFSTEQKGVRNQAGGASAIKNFSYDFSNGFTVECWVKMDPDADWQRRVYNIVTNAPGNYGPGFVLFYNWRNYMFLSGPGGSDGSKKCWRAEAPVSDLRNQWVHLAATFNGKRGRVYVNGECRGETEKDVEYHGRKVLSLTVGSGWNGLLNGFPGILDELKIYNYALSPAEIVENAKLDQ